MKNEEKETSYEKTSIKDFKFMIILMLIIAVGAIAAPHAYNYIKQLKEDGYFDKLFKKDSNEEITTTTTKSPQEIITADNTGASSPVLYNGMIPVRYNYVKKIWVKADIENLAKNEWYNYENQEWANAVLVKEIGTKKRSYYEKANPDTEIKNEDILAFFVWIPRFKYSIKSSLGVQQIDVIFESASTSKSTGPNYITHPAFTFDKELDGFWIGKYEITGAATSMTVLPNQQSVTNQNIASVFSTIQAMNGTAYGLSDDSKIKLIKNTEWGAVTYLTNSIYGRCKEEKCETVDSYYYNIDYNNQLLTSTTGNVTGVYALSGGVNEYVMANNNNIIGASGFDENFMLSSKNYYDYYQDGTPENYERAIDGDATKEFGPITNYRSSWNSGQSIFVDSNNPWCVRGADNNLYSFTSANGGAQPNIGFRITIN